MEQFNQSSTSSEPNDENIEIVVDALLEAFSINELYGYPANIDGHQNVEGISTIERIRSTAATLFAESGYDGVSINAIAARANVNKALIYYYFKDKQDLYKSIVDKYLSQLLRIWQRDDVNIGTPPERLETYIRAAYELIQNNLEVAALILSETMHKGEIKLYVITNYLLPNARNISSLIQDGIKQGYFTPVEHPISLAPMIISGVIFPNFAFSMAGKVPFSGRIIGTHEQYLEFYVNFVLKGLSNDVEK